VGDDEEEVIVDYAHSSDVNGRELTGKKTLVEQ
jgi:hypothetical protein